MFKVASVAPITLLFMTGLAAAQVGGSYRQTCDGIRQRGPYLTAQCETADGDSRVSSIDVRGCRSGITNSNGRLTCARRSSGDYEGYGYRGPRGRPGYGFRPDDGY